MTKRNQGSRSRLVGTKRAVRLQAPGCPQKAVLWQHGRGVHRPHRYLLANPRAMWRPGRTTMADQNDWTKPQALAIPKEGYFQHEQGRYGPVYPRTPACYGFSIMCKLKPGRAE